MDETYGGAGGVQRAGDEKVGADDEALWEHLTARVLPSRSGFERDVSVLWVVGVSAKGDPDGPSWGQLARWLTALGRRTAEGYDIPPMYVPEATRGVQAIVSRVAPRKRRPTVDSAVARSFARAALLGDDD